MKNFEEFYNETEEIFNEKYKGKYDDALRKNKRNSFIILFILIAVDLLIFVSFWESLFEDNAIGLGVILLFSFSFYLLLSVLFNGGVNKFSGVFKEIFIERMIKNFYDDVMYNPRAGISREIYRRGFNEHFDRYLTEDYFDGKIDGKYSIRAADVHTIGVSRDNDGDETEYTIFRGLFAEIKLDKNIDADVCISCSGIKNSFKRVKMDSATFEKIYNVYSNDNIKTLQILTADVMEKFVDVYRQFKMKYDVRVVNNIAYLRVEMDDPFEVKSVKKILDKDAMRKDFESFEKMYNMICLVIETINYVEK